MEMPRTNWAGSLTYHAERFLQPETLAEAQEAVRGATKLRAVGSRHCFNDIADTTGTQLSLERLNGVIALDEDKRQVTVEGGIRYAELGPILHERGYALHNLASLPHITVIGACATATHGSGSANGNLATAVAGIEFIDAAGDLVTLTREKNPDTFPGAIVNLGALGVVTKLTLDVQPTFSMRQDIYRDLPIGALVENFDDVMSGGYSVSLFTPWTSDVVEQVWVKSLAADGIGSAKDALFGAAPSPVKMHPVTGLDPVNCTEQIGEVGPAYDRLPHFRTDSIPAAGGDYQAEYFVAREQGPAVAKILHAEGHRLAPTLMVSEVRMVAADDLWMSPAYQKDVVAFHFSFHPDWPAIRQRLVILEELLAPFDPLPHWGKFFTLPPERIAPRYARFADFKALIESHDPDGKFRNAYVDKYVFSV